MMEKQFEYGEYKYIAEYETQTHIRQLSNFYGDPVEEFQSQLMYLLTELPELPESELPEKIKLWEATEFDGTPDFVITDGEDKLIGLIGEDDAAMYFAPLDRT